MPLFLSLFALVLTGYHVRIRQIPRPRRILAYLIVACAIGAFWAGFQLAVAEDALGRYGQVVIGKLNERISTTGEQGTAAFGETFLASLIAAEGGQFYDVLERVIATGTTDAWAVTYTYACGSSIPCRGRAFVARARWLQMRPGDAVKVRYARGTFGGARFDDDPQWATAIARMAIAIALVAAAVLISGTGDLSAGTASRSSAQPAYPAGIDNQPRYTE